MLLLCACCACASENRTTTASSDAPTKKRVPMLTTNSNQPVQEPVEALATARILDEEATPADRLPCPFYTSDPPAE